MFRDPGVSGSTLREASAREGRASVAVGPGCAAAEQREGGEAEVPGLPRPPCHRGRGRAVEAQLPVCGSFGALLVDAIRHMKGIRSSTAPL